MTLINADRLHRRDCLRRERQLAGSCHGSGNSIRSVPPGAAQDAAFAITLEPGIYLAWLTGKAGRTGRGLVSNITDIGAPPGDDATRLLNISTGNPVSTVAMVAGFIVSGLESADFVIMGERLNSAQSPPLIDEHQWRDRVCQ